MPSPSTIIDPHAKWTPSTAAAVQACGGLDGIINGTISRNELCTFDANTVVGKEIDCDATEHLITLAAGNANATVYKVRVTKEGATVMNLSWQGSPSAACEFEWYGLTRGAPVSRDHNAGNTTCELVDATGTTDSRFNCSGLPNLLPYNWIKEFIYAITENLTASSGIANWNLHTNITSRESYDEVFKLSLTTFTNWLETTVINLDSFRQRGGKLLTWHGGTDQLIVPNGTVHYYERVSKRDRAIGVLTSDHYRSVRLVRQGFEIDRLPSYLHPGTICRHSCRRYRHS